MEIIGKNKMQGLRNLERQGEKIPIMHPCFGEE